MTDMHDEWVRYPVGKLGKGAWCDHCKRYTVRNSVIDVMAIRRDPSTSSGQNALLIKRGKDPQKGWWALVGGYVEWDETLEETAKREFKEETGLTVKSLKLLGVYSDPDRDLDGRQNIAHTYVAEVEGMIAKQDDEVEDVRWFDLDDLPKNIAFDQRKMIEDYRKGVMSRK